MNKDHGNCKYCHKPLEQTRCPEDTSDSFFFLSFFLEFLGFVVSIIVLLLSYLSKHVNKPDRTKGKQIITCTNKDCIDYLNGCFKKYR